jgi:outer membrane immunogenic protein
MIHRRLLGVAYAALAVAGAVSAQAADLPTRKEAPAPVFVPPPFTWTGFYVGLNAGAVWGSGGNASTTVFANGFPIGTISGVPATLDNVFPGLGSGGGNTGFIGGGQAGYNWQTGAFVFGVETDFDGTSLSRSRSAIGPNFVEPIFGLNDFFTANGSVKLDWLGSTRGRVGYAFWDNRLLVYGTGGVAYGGASSHLDVFDAVDGFGFSTSGGSSSRVGWTAGGGVEYAFNNNWIIGGEYLYYNLGSRDLNIVPNVAASNFFGANIFSQTKIDFRGSVARARISYKF